MWYDSSMSYIYQADVWCDDCGETIRSRIHRHGEAPVDPDNECTFDSSEYPKHIDDDEESDTPQHCAAGEDCFNAITLPSGFKAGLLFGELTDEGVKYVKEAITEGGEVADLWQQHYRDKGYDV